MRAWRSREPAGARRRPSALTALLLVGAACALVAWPLTARWRGAGAPAGTLLGVPRQSAGPEVPRLRLPERSRHAVSAALAEVVGLRREAAKRGLVPGFGLKAREILDRAANLASGEGHDDAAARQVALQVGAPLHALFRRQVQVALWRALEVYEDGVRAAPNPLEAALAADVFFTTAVADLRTGGPAQAHWDTTLEKDELLARLSRNFAADSEAASLQAGHGEGAAIGAAALRRLQDQAVNIQKSVDTRGAPPWVANWQYLVEDSPLGFRGSYESGRAVLEMMLTPRPGPASGQGLIGTLGPLNLALSFDAFM